MGTTYTPEIYKQLSGTTVSVDLGKLADIGVVKDGVTALQSAVTSNQSATIDRVAGAETVLTTAIDDSSTTLGARFDSTDAAFTAAETKAAQRHTELLAAVKAIEVGHEADHPALDGDSAKFIAALLQLQEQVLHKGGAEANDVTKLRNRLQHQPATASLVDDFDKAVHGSDTGWPERTRRYWALHDLIEDVAQALEP